MIRMHQFSKVELVSITTPEQSMAEHERMTDCAQEILKRLELHHRVMTLVHRRHGFLGAEDLRHRSLAAGAEPLPRDFVLLQLRGFPGAAHERALSSEGREGTRFVHTLNGSGLAVGRTLIAVLENYQEADGSDRDTRRVAPLIMGGIEKIAPEECASSSPTTTESMRRAWRSPSDRTCALQRCMGRRARDRTIRRLAFADARFAAAGPQDRGSASPSRARPPIA